MADWEIHRNADTAAVYRLGTLWDIGDVDRMTNRVLTELGVLRINDDAFMLGQDKKVKAAPNLAAIGEWEAQRHAFRARKAALREEIAALRAELESLDSDPSL